MFSVTQGCGFHMTFANGYTVSVQWGPANYCENRDYNFDYGDSGHRQAGEKGSSTAEVACWDANGKWVKLGENDDVLGWQTSEQVADVLALVATFPKVAKSA